ncbi:hypothetical protein SLE2022_080520 [Rubroshorea leprosula]
MADALVSAILGKLATIISKEAEREVKLVTGVEKEINKLSSNLESIEALLQDADERQIKDRSIRSWLTKLKDVCYDMEDVLDEWNTALLKFEVDEADLENSDLSKGKVCRPFILCFSFGRQVVHRRDIALKIKEINERLDVIAKGKDSYQLVPRVESRDIRPESIAFTELSKLHGRDEIKNDIINSLLGGSSDEIESDIKTISVVGMGGVGKTALAQLIYHDHAIETHFKWRIWVSIPENSEERRVAEEIIVALAENHPRDDLSKLSLQMLVKTMRESIEGKKVFLVLDDMWSDERKRWEQLNEVFKPAASGSRILVTTRKDTVAEAMNSVCKFPLKQLTNSVCWKIISQEAFVGRDKEQCKSLEDIGKEIAKRCSGLPLVAKTLGGMLRFKKTSDDWKNILDSDKWQVDLVEKEVYVPLLLSFYDLPSAVRRCFLYCSIFPKDFLIVREDVIYQWMAQGYLISDKNAEMEITGAEFFDCLVERSFFQDLEIFEDGSIWRCKIHDITVDFARFLMRNEFMSKELHSDVELSLEKTRHLLVRQMSGTSFPMLLGAEKLRSLTIFYSHEKETSQRSLTISDIHEKETSQALCKLFIEPKCVRSLNFYWVQIDGFPKEVGKLLHLRSLNLAHSMFQSLPEAVCELWNLQSLLMPYCARLRGLPNKMEKLVNLRHLDMTGCSRLAFFPRGIGRLTSLRDLY